MEIPSLVVGLMLVGLSVAYIGLPFQKKQRKGVKTAKSQVNASEQRGAVLSAIRDLDFDFKIGKISEEDYAPLRAQLLVEAAQAIESSKVEEDKLEAVIQARRASKAKNKCDQCSTPLEAGQKFCSKCGSAVKQESCPHCGKKIRVGDQFCTGCGTRLEVRAEAVA